MVGGHQGTLIQWPPLDPTFSPRQAMSSATEHQTSNSNMTPLKLISMSPRSKAEIMCMIRAMYIDRISIVIWWKYWILLTPCPSFLALGSWMWRNELRSVCVTDCRLASLPAQQLSWCRHHSKLSAGAWIFAVLTPSNNNTNIFIVIMLDIFKVNAICWIHWHWALNLPGNLTSMNWLLSGLPDCHGLGPGPPRSSEAANFRLCFHKHSELLSSYFSKLAGRVAGHGTFPSNLSNV